MEMSGNSCASALQTAPIVMAFPRAREPPGCSAGAVRGSSGTGLIARGT